MDNLKSKADFGALKDAVDVGKLSGGLDKDAVNKFKGFKMSDVPKMEMPAMEVPKLEAAAPVVELPSVPTPAEAVQAVADEVKELVSAPSTPNVPTFEIEAPKFEMPKASQMPKFDVPKVDIPKFDASKFDIPKVDVPKFDASKFDIPKVDVPKVDLPKVDVDFSGATKSINDATKSLNDVTSGATKSLNDAASTATKSLNEGKAAIDSSIKNVEEAINSLQSGVNSAVGETVTGAVTTVKASLPEEFAALVDQAKDNTDLAVVLGIVGVVGVIGVRNFIDDVRGFAGSKRPNMVADELEKNRRAFLIDTRSLELRKRDGIPDLVGAARERGAAVPVDELDARTRSLSRNAREVELTIAAEKVMRLTKRGSQIYFIGPNAAALAKVVTSNGGRRCFTVSGDFEAWRSAGLKIRRSERYEKNVAEVLGEETGRAVGSATQSFKKSVGTTKKTITTAYEESNNAQKAAILVGVVALLYAATEYEKSLQFIGFMGIIWSVTSRFATYDSPFDVFEDVASLGEKSTSLLKNATSVAGSAAALSTKAAKAISSTKEASDLKVPSLADMSIPMDAPVPSEAETTDSSGEAVEEN